MDDKRRESPLSVSLCLPPTAVPSSAHTTHEVAGEQLGEVRGGARVGRLHKRLKEVEDARVGVEEPANERRARAARAHDDDARAGRTRRRCGALAAARRVQRGVRRAKMVRWVARRGGGRPRGGGLGAVLRGRVRRGRRERDGRRRVVVPRRSARVRLRRLGARSRVSL